MRKCVKCPYHGLEHGTRGTTQGTTFGKVQGTTFGKVQGTTFGKPQGTFGEIVEQDGKIFWAHTPLHPKPFGIPFYERDRIDGTNGKYVHDFLQIDMECSLLDSAYNTMDIRHPEYVHDRLGFGSTQSPLNIKSYYFKDRVGLAFDYMSNDLMKWVNQNGNTTENFHMYIYPSFTWSRVSFQNKNLIISVNLLPLAPKKTRWFVTISHDYNTDALGQTFLKQLAKLIVGQDYGQLKNQVEESELKKRLLFQHIFPDEEVLKGLRELLRDYEYPDMQSFLPLL